MHCRKVSKAWTTPTAIHTHWGLLKNLRALGPYLAFWGSNLLIFVFLCRWQCWISTASRSCKLFDGSPWRIFQDIFPCYFGSLQLVVGLMRLTPQLPASEPPSLPGALFSFQISFKELDCYLLTLAFFLFFPLDFSLSFFFLLYF